VRGISVSQRLGFAVAALSLATAAPISAEAQTAAASSGNCPYWIDVKTGQPWPSVPQGSSPQNISPGDKDWHNPRNGRSFAQLPDGSWIDVQTGQPWPSVPQGSSPQNIFPGDKDWHNPRNGRSFALVPCPPTQTSMSGVYIGGELVKNWGWVRSTERLATTDVITNRFTDTADPVGGGLIVGYKFAPWANSVIVSPFASFDFLHAPVNHTFPSGSYLGTTANFMGTAGVKVGPQLGTGLWLYGIAGVSVLNETLNVNFLPVVSSSSATVPGATVGVGGAWQPSFLQGFGRPVSLFLEYQHTWWQSANFNTPAASPFFNYNFARQDDVVKFGFTASLSAPPPVGAPSYPVKAPVK
jgi:hypothetical protein